MNTQNIEAYMADLGQELSVLGVQTHAFQLLMIGGAYMLTQVGNRQATKDIDVVFTNPSEPRASPLYYPFRVAARTVAQRYALPVSWINDVIGDALRNYGPIPQGTLWRSFGPLDVYIPSAEYILALKILAGRPGDIADARALCQRIGVSTREAARRIVDTYITDQQIKQLNDMDTTVQQLFP